MPAGTGSADASRSPADTDLQAGLTAGAAARRLGVAVTTLRSWHRRYGIGPSTIRPGRHRRYRQADLDQLDQMQRLVAEGVPPAQAARAAAPQAARTAAPQAASALARAASAARRDGGGLPLGGARNAARGLSRAAMRLDATAVRQRLAAAISADGVIATWEQMICPVLVAVGTRNVVDGSLIDVEHMLSRCVSAAFGSVRKPPENIPVRALLSCADEEQHSLPIEALEAALAERMVACRSLGARVPAAALIAAVRRTGPLAVVVWSQQSETGQLSQITALLAERPRPAVVIAAGPGWDRALLPPAVSCPISLSAATELLSNLHC